MVEDIDEFERDLRRQLEPRPAPEGFTDRLMARLPARAPGTHRLLSLRPVWQWAAIAAVLALMIGGGLEHQRRVAGERARAQVLLALRITGSTLHDVQQKISADSADDASSTHPPRPE